MFVTIAFGVALIGLELWALIESARIDWATKEIQQLQEEIKELQKEIKKNEQ